MTLGPDLSGLKTSGSSSASVHPDTETEPLHFDDVELEGLEGELEELNVDNQGLGIDTGLDYQHGTDLNALEVPASALCTELTGSSSSTSALVDVDLESEEQFDPRIEYANEMDPNALDLIGKKVKVPVSYYGAHHRDARLAYGVSHETETIVSFIPKSALRKPEVMKFVKRAYAGRRKKITHQDYWFATESVDGYEQWYPFTRTNLTNWGNPVLNKTAAAKIIKERAFLERAAELDERRREPNLGPHLVEVVETDEEWTEMPSQSEMSMQSDNEEIESLIKHIKEATVNRPDWDLSWTKRAKDMIVDLEAQDFVLNYCLSRRKTVFPESADSSKQARRSGNCGQAISLPQRDLWDEWHGEGMIRDQLHKHGVNAQNFKDEVLLKRAVGKLDSGSRRLLSQMSTETGEFLKACVLCALNLPHTVETLKNYRPCDFCTKTLGKTSNSRSKKAATRTCRFCVDCDMYLCKLCSKTFKKHAEASKLRTKNALETARKKVYASNAKPPRHLLQQTSAV